MEKEMPENRFKRVGIYRCNETSLFSINSNETNAAPLLEDAKLIELALRALEHPLTIIHSPTTMLLLRTNFMFNRSYRPLTSKEYARFEGIVLRNSPSQQQSQAIEWSDDPGNALKVRLYSCPDINGYVLAQGQDADRQIALSAPTLKELAEKTNNHNLMVVHTDRRALFLDGKGKSLVGEPVNVHTFRRFIRTVNV